MRRRCMVTACVLLAGCAVGRHAWMHPLRDASDAQRDRATCSARADYLTALQGATRYQPAPKKVGEAILVGLVQGLADASFRMSQFNTCMQGLGYTYQRIPDRLPPGVTVGTFNLPPNEASPPAATGYSAPHAEPGRAPSSLVSPVSSQAFQNRAEQWNDALKRQTELKELRDQQVITEEVFQARSRELWKMFAE